MLVWAGILVYAKQKSVFPVPYREFGMHAKNIIFSHNTYFLSWEDRIVCLDTTLLVRFKALNNVTVQKLFGFLQQIQCDLTT